MNKHTKKKSLQSKTKTIQMPIRKYFKPVISAAKAKDKIKQQHIAKFRFLC
jgi:hypothetical protein